MSQNFLIEQTDASGSTLVICPMFTYRAFAEGNVIEEWEGLKGRLLLPVVQAVIVDLSALPFFGSTVLEWMVQLWKQMKDKPGKFVICNPSPVGVQILQAARLHTVWPLYATRAEAITAVASQPES